MPLELRLLTGLALALGVAYLSTPIAIRVAIRLDFLDRPAGGYKDHAAPTPYLGGAAVLAGFLVAALALGADWRVIPVLTGAVVLWVVGTIDDRTPLTPGVRVAVEAAIAAGLWSLGLGWDLGAGPLVDFVATVGWVVVVVNAFNIFDNMDGVATTMGGVIAAGLAVLGIAHADPWQAVTAAALCGACIGFLPHNLASPSRIFLGDGGSLPVGFAIAALSMIGLAEAAPAWQSLGMAALFVGIPTLDLCLRVVARRRVGQSIFIGGRDGLAHWTKRRVRNARAVVVALGSAQALISVLAVVAMQGGPWGIVPAVLLYLMAGGLTIALLDVREPPAQEQVIAGGAVSTTAKRAEDRRALVVILLIVPLSVLLGISPFFGGYYDSQIWVPAGLALIVFVTAGVIARPLRLSAPALVGLIGLGGLGAWAICSTLWAESIEQAVVDANRVMVLAALLGGVLLLVRTERSALWLVGVLTATALGLAGYTLGRMLTTEASDLFVGGRLDSPLGYINGQGSYYLLAIWPCIALAEQRRWPLLSGLGLGAATLLGSLLVLSQSRGVALAAIVSTIVVIALVPGRVRRGWALVVLLAALAPALPYLLDVYERGVRTAVPDDAATSAATSALLAGLGAAVVWGAITGAASASESASARLRPVATGVLIAGVIAAAGLAVASSDRITRTIDRQYTAFVHLGIEPQGSGVSSPAAASTRLASGAGNRYDYWRIAWRSFRDRPLLGTGAGNYDRPYFEQRSSTEDVRQPHSIALQALGELGLVGGLFLLAFIGALGAGAYRLARLARLSPVARFLAVAATGAVTAWLVHTSVDWIHLLPGVTSVALAMAAVLLMRRDPDAEPVAHAAVQSPGRRLRPHFVPAVAVAIALAVAGVSLSRQGLSEHFRLDAQHELSARPAEALRDADRALRLDPESVPSYYVKAAALARFNEPAAARAALMSAAAREPHDFVTWALLGDLAMRTGNLDQATSAYNRAVKLNPRDVALRTAARDARAALRRADVGG